jgi:probable HAF family extracellular repeat protein
MEHSILIKIACTLTSVLFISSAASAVTFDIHELGTLGGTRTYANAINDSGQVTGYSYLNGDATYHAFLGNVGGLTDLGTLGGDLSVGYAINNSGKVVGFTRTAPNSFANTYFIGDANQLTDLGKPANTNYFAARGINDSGLISGYVGYQFGSSQLGRATTLQNGAFTDYGFIENGQISQFFGNNNSGQSIGHSYFNEIVPVNNANGEFRAVIGENGSLTDLGTLGGTKSWGMAINDNGIATGASFTVNNQERHIYYGDSAGLTDVGTLGGSWGYGRAINNNGEIVGNSQTSTGQSHAFYYDGIMLYDLNDLIADLTGWDSLSNATGISNTGYITGTGKLTSGETRSFILKIASSDNSGNVIPEPATLALFCLGLAGIACKRKKLLVGYAKRTR